MRWQNIAQGEFVGDWLAQGLLDQTDPYLLWLDVSRFVGTPLHGRHTRVIPTIRERSDSEKKFGTDALRPIPGAERFDSLLAMVKPKKPGDTLRFEVAAGFISDGGADGSTSASIDRYTGPAGDDRRTGKDAKPLIGFIDYGCAFANKQFRGRQPAGLSTRVLAIWDQSPGEDYESNLPKGLQRLQWRFPSDFPYGAETHRDAHWGHTGALTLDLYIRQFLQHGQLDEEALYRHCGYPAIQDRSATHGTHVMDLATGFPNPLDALSGGAPSPAHDADIVFVQLPRHIRNREISGLLRANVYDGIRYILSCAHPGQPVIINLSYGGNAGPHDGSSVLEQAMDWRLKRARKKLGANVNLVLPAGNAREAKLHAVAEVSRQEPATFIWNNPPDDPSESFVEVWLPNEGDFQVSVVAPAGLGASKSLSPGQAGTWVDKNNRVVAALVFAKAACQSRSGRMVLLAVAKTRKSDSPSAPYGRWTLQVQLAGQVPATVHAWCERDTPPFGSTGVPRQAYFSPTSTSHIDRDGTLNSIAHGTMPVVVGGLVLGAGVAQYSGTGPGRGLGNRQRHPSPAAGPSALRGPQALAASDESSGAPGLLAAAVYGSDKVRLAGTSMAAAVMTRRIFEGKRTPSGARGRRKLRLPTHPDDDLLSG